MKHIYFPSAFCVAAGLMFLSQPSFAQVQDFCEILAGRISPDISAQSTSDDRFSIFQQIISNEKYRSFITASNSTLDAGLSIVSYVDGFLDTTSDSKSWETTWENFRKSTYAQASSKFQRTSFESRWSTALISNLVENCSAGFKGLLTSVTPARDAFTIRLRGSGTWSLTGIQTSPSDKAFRCSGYEAASAQQPVSFVNEAQMACSKDPNVTLLLTVSTTQGSAGPFTLDSVADALRKQHDSDTMQIRSLGAQLEQLKQTVQNLSSKVDGFQVTLVPSQGKEFKQGDFWTAQQNTPVWFTCPGKSVLAGLDFDMFSNGNIRGPSRVNYICKTIQP